MDRVISDGVEIVLVMRVNTLQLSAAERKRLKHQKKRKQHDQHPTTTQDNSKKLEGGIGGGSRFDSHALHFSGAFGMKATGLTMEEERAKGDELVAVADPLDRCMHICEVRGTRRLLY